MNLSSAPDPVSRYADLYQSRKEQLPGAGLSWLAGQRERAQQRIRRDGFPTRRSEAWRYLDLKPLLGRDFGAAIAVADDGAALAAEHRLADCYRMVFLDGRFLPQASDLPELPGMTLTGLGAWIDAGATQGEKLLADRETQASPFRDLAVSLAGDGALIEIPAGSRLDKPIDLLHLYSEGAAGAGIHKRSRVRLQAGAGLVLIERHLGLHDGELFVNQALDVDLEANAELTLYRLQKLGAATMQLGDLRIRQQADSRLKVICAALSGRLSRCDLAVSLEGQGASAEIQGLYVAGDGQATDFHTRIDHKVPHCSSQEHFRGILQGKGRAVFDGLIYVHKDAQKTSAHLSNKNLMLSRDAEVDAKPQLEIYADDVQCSHGTTVGELEQNMMFYLRSRGIPEQQARAMLCHAFADSILDSIRDESVRTLLTDWINHSLLLQ